MPVPVVHIGYHKTATTWLQQRFFPVLGDGVAVFGHEALRRDLIGPSQLQFKRRRCKRYVATLIAGQPGRACVFSAERLSGHPHSGGYDASEMADRVKAAFGEAKILILVREQVSMLVASYKQYIKGRGVLTLDEYLVPPRDRRIPLFRLDNFCYHHLIEYYLKLFGGRHVLVLPYELLLHDRDGFVRRLLEYIGLDGFSFPPPNFDPANQCLADRPSNTAPAMGQFPLRGLFATSREAEGAAAGGAPVPPHQCAGRRGRGRTPCGEISRTSRIGCRRPVCVQQQNTAAVRCS